MSFPKRIFLDTCVVNLLVEYGEPIFDGFYEPTNNLRINNDVYALHYLFTCEYRCTPPIVVSPTTYQEVIKTNDMRKRRRLMQYVSELWHYFDINMSDKLAVDFRHLQLVEEHLSNYDFKFLPVSPDRQLILEALSFKCDYFCTRDWKSLLKYRDKITSLPIKFFTPSEWLEMLAC
jgi:hypothetical protein